MIVERRPSGRWRAAYRDPAGRRHSRTFDTKAAARAWAADQEQLVRRGRHRDPRSARQPLRDYERLWWAARVAETSTLTSDRGRLDKHVLAEWGEWPLDAISTTAVQGWVRRLVRGGLAPATSRSCLQLLTSILESARLDGLLPDNPCRGVTTPPPAQGRETFLTREQVAATCERVEPDDEAVIITLAYTGMRWGELAGLHAGRLDLIRRRIEVAETLVEVSGARTVKGYPKGKKRRSVPLAEIVVQQVAAYLARHPARLTGPCGFEHQDGRRCDAGQLVFRHTAVGALSRHTWGRDVFAPALAAAGVPRCRVHDLRHTCASWLVQDGVPLFEVGRLLGHASVTTTERYAHFAPDRYDRVLAALDRGQAGVKRRDNASQR